MVDGLEPFVPAGYGDDNRAFLQAFMARGILTADEGQTLLFQIFQLRSKAHQQNGYHDNGADEPTVPTEEDFTRFVRMAREAVAPLDYDIRNTRHQRHRGQRIWALVNAHSDPATQLATAHTADEIAYLRRLLDAIFDTYNTPRMEVMAVDEGQVLKLSRPARPAGQTQGNGDDDDDDDGAATQATAHKGLKHSEVLALLKSLVAEGWLEKSRAGFYSMSPRSLMELMSWLTETYNSPDAEEGDWQRIKSCEACKETVTYGQRCAERDCMVRLHDICEEGFWRARRDHACPKCKTDWDGKHYVGERAVTMTQAYQRSRVGRASTGGRGSNAPRIQAIAADADDSDMGE